MGKTILITGISRGIGSHLAKAFLKEGYKVIGLSRTLADFQDDSFQQIQVDVGNLSQLETISRELPLDSLDGIIHNAGIHGPLGPFENNDLQEWVHTFYVNLFGGVLLAQKCIPALKKKNGFIIFLSGGGSGFAVPNFTAYGVSKTAVVRFIENLALEIPEIYSYCVAPGPNRTPLLENAIKTGTQVKEEDIVTFDYPIKLCLFLANNKDQRYSGRFIHVKDNYKEWDERHFTADMYKLRRIKVV